MKLSFLPSFFLIITILLFSSCSKDDKAINNDFVEDIRLQGFLELIETGTTDKIDVLDFYIEEETQENEASLRSGGPQTFGYVSNEKVSASPECCDVIFEGYSQHDWWSKPFVISVQELGIEEPEYNQWIHFDIDEVDMGKNFERHAFDEFRPAVAEIFDVVPCTDGFRRGIGLIFPVGTFSSGFYQINVEKGYNTLDGEPIVCSSTVGFAEYGCGEFISCE